MADRIQELKDVVDKHVEELMLHFDTVQIHVSLYDRSSDETETYDSGSGNWLTRYGQMREAILKQDERVRMNEHSD